MKATRDSWLRIGVLALVVCMVWGYMTGRWSPDTWGVPAYYGNGDELQILGWIKAAQEGDYRPFCTKTVERLGAPYQGHWNDYPMYEQILTFGLGMVARAVGLLAASNVGVVLGYVFSALSFYLCCRLLRYNRVWAFAGAVLFAFMYYHTYCQLAHLFLAYSYTLPFAILSCWLVLASKRCALRTRWGGLCLGTGLVMGLSNPYNLGMYIQLMVLSLAAHFLLYRRKANLIVGAAALAVAVAGFAVVNLGTFIYQYQHGRNPLAIARAYWHTELFALKPIELIIPPASHMISALADLGHKYAGSTMLKGELYSPYLGLVGITGLVWMLAEWFLRTNRLRCVPRRLPAHAFQVQWVMCYSVIGGLNCLAAFGGFMLFRSSNRYSIFIAALVLLFLVSRMSRWTRRWSRRRAAGVAVVCVAVGLVDQITRPPTAAATRAVAQRVAADREFAARMEAALPAGAMVFQLPIMLFPEGESVHQLKEYELLRPYYFTRALRFSFGAAKGRPESDWQSEVAGLPPALMVQTLERHGFAALYLNRKGFPDRAEGLLRQLAEAGCTQVLEDPLREQVCVLLQPAPQPRLPGVENRALIQYRRGWSMIIEKTPGGLRRWTNGNAELTFFNESARRTTFVLTATIATLTARNVQIELGPSVLWSANLPPNQGVPIRLTVTGEPRYNMLRLVTDQPAVQPAPEIPIPVAFAVMNLRMERVE